MTLSPQLLQILVCPVDKGGLYYLADEDALYNPRLRRRYAVREGIPVMLADEAEDRRRRGARAAAGQGGDEDGLTAHRRGLTPSMSHDGDRTTLDRVDTLGMWDVTFGLADQLAAAAAAVAAAIGGLPEPRRAIDHVVVLGHGWERHRR